MRTTRTPLAVSLGTLLLAVTTVAAPALHAQSNVALGAAVTGFGGFGGNADRDGFVWPNPAPAPLSTLTDGVVLPDGTQWQTGTVWWDRGELGTAGENPDAFFDTRVEVDLGSVFSLGGVGLSHDNNDDYGVFFRESEADAWSFLGAFFCESCNAGLSYAAVPDIGFTFSARYLAVAGSAGDGWYSLSEIEAYAAQVPEPMSLLLLLAGMSGIGLASRRRQLRPR